VQTFTVAATSKHAAGVLINDKQLTIHNNIILIALE
jgi:hypothetical protein